jgi:predicted nucleic acid-binding protein
LRFWDSSAVVPLLVDQAASRACRQLLRADPVQVVWCFTRTEVVSALRRLFREGMVDPDDLRRIEQRLERLAGHWSEIHAVDPVRDAAERVLRTHPLRAADALQLGAALVGVDGRPRGRAFVSLDPALLGAADREGFRTFRPDGT